MTDVLEQAPRLGITRGWLSGSLTETFLCNITTLARPPESISRWVFWKYEHDDVPVNNDDLMLTKRWFYNEQCSSGQPADIIARVPAFIYKLRISIEMPACSAVFSIEKAAKSIEIRSISQISISFPLFLGLFCDVFLRFVRRWATRLRGSIEIYCACRWTFCQNEGFSIEQDWFFY